MELSQASESNERWLQLKAENKFDVEVAKAVSTPLKDQCALAKNLDELWINKESLPSIRSEIKYSGEATAVLKMIKLLNPISMIAAGNNALANESGMQYAAEMIVNDVDLKLWKLVEFRNLVDMAIKGQFGVIYNRVDVSVLYEWINKYRELRLIKIENEKLKEQKLHEDDLRNMHPNVAKELLKAFPKQPEKITAKKYSTPGEFLKDNPIVEDQFTNEWIALEQGEREWYNNRGGRMTYVMERAIMVMKEVNGVK